ncbi:MAG: hypothetical protein ACLRTQ_07040 [Candidatus Borkfalkia sp.]
MQAQLDAALKRIEELEANKASKWLGIIALLVGIFGTVGAVWFIIDKFAGKELNTEQKLPPRFSRRLCFISVKGLSSGIKKHRL